MTDEFTNIEALQLLEELRKRQEHDYHKYVPNDKQKAFHESQNYIRLLFGGNQSGKSKANAHEVAWWLTGEHPYRHIPSHPRVIWVISTEYQTIRAGIYRHLINILPPWEIKAFGPKVQGHDLHSYIKMKNGSTVYFLSSKGGEDARTKFQAEAVDYIAIDEEIEEYIFDECQARLLATGGCFGISATLVESYEWIVTLEQRGLSGDEDVFITRMRTQDNQYLNEEQVRRLESKWDVTTKEYRLEGKSRRKTGLVYPNFSHWIEPFDIPGDWTKFHVLDPGYRVCAGLWGAVTQYGQLILYRELYQQYSGLDTVVNEINAVETEEIDFKIIDDKEGSHLITGEVGVLSLMARDYGRFYTPAIKAKLAGIEQVRSWLRTHKTDEYYDYGNDIRLPKGQRLFVFNTLEFFRYELLRYRINPDKSKRDKNESVDAPIKAKDHLMDCWRYMCMANPSYQLRDRDDAVPVRVQSSRSLIDAFEATIERNSRGRINEFFGTTY